MRSLLVALAACGSASPPPSIANQAPAPAVDPNESLRIVYERTACPTTCAQYRVEISSGHTVVWHGIANVKTIGEAHGAIDDRQLDKIRIALELADFDHRDERGALPGTPIATCEDPPGVEITVVRHDLARTIDRRRFCGPDPGLDQLEATLDEVAGTAAWK